MLRQHIRVSRVLHTIVVALNIYSALLNTKLGKIVYCGGIFFTY
jgi:membrane protein involved in colicin uptake